MIPDWLHAIANPATPQAEPVQQNALAEIQKQLQALISEVKNQRAGANEKPSEPSLADSELLCVLIERIHGRQNQGTPPIGNGQNGKAGSTNPPE